MIWWLWTDLMGFSNDMFDVSLEWEMSYDFGTRPDIYWLGECAWTAVIDNMGIKLSKV